MTTPTYLLPIWNGDQFFDKNGNILAGGKIFTYQNESFSVQQTTYQGTDDSTSPNPQPIVLDVDGRMPTQMYGQQGLYYNLLLTDSSGAADQPGNTVASQTGIIGSAPSVIPAPANTAISVWNITAAPTYVSPTQFLVPGNLVSDFFVGNRVQFRNGASAYGYGTVTAVSYTAPNTQVTLQNDSTAIASNLQQVAWSSLVANGITVDAGAVSYSSALTYTNAATVGGQITNIIATQAADVSTVNTAIADRNTVYGTTGTFSSGGTAFALTPTPAATSIGANESYDVVFNAAGGTTPTLNISALGAHAVVELSSTGTYVAAVITAGLTSRILYNGSQYVLQNQLPISGTSSASFGVNGEWIDDSTGFTTIWGSFTTTTAAGTVTVTFPDGGFPTACYAVVFSPSGPSGLGANWEGNILSVTRTGWTFRTSSGSNVGMTVYYQAVGH